MSTAILCNQPGRTRAIGGTGRRAKTYTGQSYTYELKLQVIDFLRESGSISATTRRFFSGVTDSPHSSTRKLIYKWSAARDHIEKQVTSSDTASQRRTRPPGTGLVLPLSVEAALVKWINDLRRDGVPVSAAMLRDQACEVAEEAGISRLIFAASWQWRRGFMKRYRFSFRSKTHQGQQAPTDAVQQAAALASEVVARAAAKGIRHLYNTDQTAMSFELLPRTTIDAKGSSTVWVRCGKKEKQRVTAMLLGDSNGKKYPLFLIMKSAPSKIPSVQEENNRLRHGFGRRMWNEIERLQAKHGVQIYANRTAWWTGTLTVDFLRYHFGYRTTASEPIMLLLDDFSGHWMEEALGYATALNIELVKVPPGLTWLCQPADRVWIKPVKDRLRRAWIIYLQQQLDRRVRSPNRVPFCMAPPSRADVTAWISSAWADVSNATIRSGFVSCGLCDGVVAADNSLADADLQRSTNHVIEQISALRLFDREERALTDRDDVVDSEAAA